MHNFSIADSIRKLRKEKDQVAENWQGETSTMYLQALEYYINQAIAIEKTLELINEGYDVVITSIEENEDTVKIYGAKKL